MDNNLRSLIESFSQKKILLIGDTILDHYIYGTVIGTSAETPTLVAREEREEFSLGGASLVCRNLLQMNAHVDFLTLVGEDGDAEEIKRFNHPHLRLHTFTEEGRQTTVKRRFWVDGYKLLQFDKLDNRPISAKLEGEIAARVKGLLPNISALVISDYRHGLLTEGLIQALLQLAKAAGKSCFVDSQVSQKQSNHHLYRGASLICLNLKEAQSIDQTADLHILREKLDALNIVIKKGAEGARALIGEREFDLPGHKVEPVDSCGAGDAFLAALALGDLNDAETSLNIANRWAALSTTVKGPNPPSFASFLESL